MIAAAVQAPIAGYRRARTRYEQAVVAEDAAFARWFAKKQAMTRTNGAAAARLANETSFRSAELSVAQGELYRLDIDPWTIDDLDGAERTFVGA